VHTRFDINTRNKKTIFKDHKHARARSRERLNEPGETVGIVFYFARKNIEFKREHKSSSTHF